MEFFIAIYTSNSDLYVFFQERGGFRKKEKKKGENPNIYVMVFHPYYHIIIKNLCGIKECNSDTREMNYVHVFPRRLKCRY